MAKDITGPIAKVQIDGITFFHFAEGDVTFHLAQYKNELVPTSGPGLQKRTKVAPEAKGLSLKDNEAEALILKAKAEALDDVTLNVTLANGAVLRALGFLNFDSWSATEFKASVDFQPRTGWQVFSS